MVCYYIVNKRQDGQVIWYQKEKMHNHPVSYHIIPMSYCQHLLLRLVHLSCRRIKEDGVKKCGFTQYLIHNMNIKMLWNQFKSWQINGIIYKVFRRILIHFYFSGCNDKCLHYTSVDFWLRRHSYFTMYTMVLFYIILCSIENHIILLSLAES